MLSAMLLRRAEYTGALQRRAGPGGGMSATGKLAGFAALLLLVFGGALAAGGAIGPERDGGSAGGGGHSDPDAAHGGTAAAAPDPVRGLAVSGGGLQLALEQTELPAAAQPSCASASSARRRPVRDFEVVHEQRMHVIVVRRDARGFQHLHPELGDDGVWRVQVTLPEAGSYRVFADFKHDGEAQTLAADLAVDGEADYRPLPAPAATAAPATATRFAWKRALVPAARPGWASASAVTASRSAPSPTWAPAAIWWRCARATSPTCTCTRRRRPDGQLHDRVPERGPLPPVLQFKHEGRVHTAEFTQEVTR